MKVSKNIDRIERFDGNMGPGFTILLSNGDLKFWGFTKEGKRIVMVWDSKVTELKNIKTF